jgi:hypothetical protein
MKFSLLLSVLISTSLRADDALVIASATGDLNGHGRPDTIAIVMTDGEEYVDDNEWCNMSYGGKPKYRGHFVVRVALAGQKPTETALNSLLWASRAMAR